MDLPLTVIECQLTRGCILHSEEIFDYISHGKFFVIIGEDDNDFIGFFFINSKINDFISRKPELLALQFILSKEDYAFLDYDSYLCCTEIKKLNKKELANSVSVNKTQIKGFLHDEHQRDILQIVRKSKLFSQKEKNTFFK